MFFSDIHSIIYNNLAMKCNLSKGKMKISEFTKNKNGIKEKLVFLPYLPTPPLGQDMTQGQFFKQNLTGLNSEFSFS